MHSAGVEREAFAADQPQLDAAAQNRLEHLAEENLFAEPPFRVDPSR